METTIGATISTERASQIAALAETIADRYCPIGKVDPEAIIQREGIELVYGRYKNEFDGIIEYEGDHFEIRCNLDRENSPDSPRGRFTLGHELGHYFIDEHREALVSGVIGPHASFCDVPSTQSRREQEANLFASQLLIPGGRFIAFLPRARKTLSGIVDIAEKFQVSITCAAIRYIEDEVKPSIVVYWSRDNDRWKWLSKAFRARKHGRLIEALSSLPPDSPTRICAGLGNRRSGVLGKKTLASIWFPSLRNTGERDLKLREEALNLGRYGVLTLLTISVDQTSLRARSVR